MLKVFNDKDDDFLIQHYPIWGATKCAEALGVKREQVHARVSYLRKSGVSDVRMLPETLHELLKRPKPQRPEKVSTAQFETPSTPESVYLLGLLWADGCVYANETTKTYKVIINMVAEDLACLEPQFDAVGKWNKYLTPKKVGKTQRTFVVNGKRLVHFLEKWGYRSKNERPKILDLIPKHLVHYWFRGLMDGDGCFFINHNQNSVSICGPKDQDWSYAEDIMKELGVEYRIRVTGSSENGGSRSMVCITNLRSIVKWGEYIYAGHSLDGMGLVRKLEKFKLIKERYEKSPWWRNHEKRQSAKSSGVRWIRPRKSRAKLKG